MTGALIPSNSVNRACHSSYAAQCGSSMLEFTSTDFGYELSVAANYGRAGNFVACYPAEAGNENSFNLAWEPQSVYSYQPSLGCEFGGLFGAAGGGGSVRRQNLMHSQRFGHQGKGAGGGAGGPMPSGKSKPRRRVATVAQRRAANIRERRRVFGLNEAFDILRKKVPTFAYEKRLSRIETLRLAITYIAFMTEVLQGKYPRDEALFADGDRAEHRPWAGQQSLGAGLASASQCRGSP